MTTQRGPTANILSSLVSGGDENRTTCVRTSRPKAVTIGTQPILPIGMPLPSDERQIRVVDLPNFCWACRTIFRTSTTADISDRKSTRLNSSHLVISYAVFCLKKKLAILPEPHRTDPRALPRTLAHAAG